MLSTLLNLTGLMEWSCPIYAAITAPFLASCPVLSADATEQTMTPTTSSLTSPGRSPAAPPDTEAGTSPGASSAAPPARPRIIGLDVARALALLGMMVNHLMEPDGWSAEIFRGFPSALFAVMAGFSLSIMGARGVREGGGALAGSRHGLIVRGAVLIALGALIEPFAGTIQVVPSAFGICYVALACAPRWRTSTLAVVAGLLVAACAISHVLNMTVGVPASLVPVMSGPYPAVVWAAYMVIGVIAHRLLTRSTRAQLLTVLVGVPLAVVGTVLRGYVDLDAMLDSGDLGALALTSVIDPTAHSGGLIDMVTSVSGALAVIALCLLVFKGGWWSFPLQAMGSMSLTVYVAHVLSAGPFLVEDAPERLPVLGAATVLLSLALATLIRLRFRHGPLEWTMRRLIRLATDRNRPGISRNQA